MTKQQLFSLYLTNPNQRVRHYKVYPSPEECDKTDGKQFWYDYELRAVYNTNKDYCVVLGLENQSATVNISDLKLILKPRASMPENVRVIFRSMDKPELFGHSYNMQASDIPQAYMTFEQTILLIENGYCLDEQWIKNGWVELGE